MARRWVAAAVLLAAGAAASGCGGATPQVPVATDAPTVSVTMTEFALALNPPALTAGTYRFHAVNAGRTAHVLVLAGPGITEQRTPVLAPGQTAELAATLPAGGYDLSCPLDGPPGHGHGVAHQRGRCRDAHTVVRRHRWLLNSGPISHCGACAPLRRRCSP